MKRLWNVGKGESRNMSSHAILDSESCKCTVRGEEDLYWGSDKAPREGKRKLTTPTIRRTSSAPQPLVMNVLTYMRREKKIHARARRTPTIAA